MLFMFSLFQILMIKMMTKMIMLILLLMATTSNVAGPWAMDRHSGNKANYEASTIDKDTSEITPNEDNSTPDEDPCTKWVAVTPSEDLPTQAWPAALPSGDSPLDSPLYVGRAESGEGVLPVTITRGRLEGTQEVIFSVLEHLTMFYLQVEVLTLAQDGHCGLSWQPPVEAQLPRGAVLGGKKRDRGEVYICSARVGEKQ